MKTQEHVNKSKPEKVQIEKEVTNTEFSNSTEGINNSSIESMQTYNDYLNMYSTIVEKYLSDYEKAIHETVLYDESSFREMKKGHEESLREEQQKYSLELNQKLV